MKKTIFTGGIGLFLGIALVVGFRFALASYDGRWIANIQAGNNAFQVYKVDDSEISTVHCYVAISQNQMNPFESMSCVNVPQGQSINVDPTVYVSPATPGMTGIIKNVKK